MAVVTPADILTAIKARWNLDATLTQLIPGGIQDSRVARTMNGQLVPKPYAVVTVVEGQQEFNSSKKYWQPFTVSLKVWSSAGNTQAGQILNCVDGLFNRDYILAELQVPGADNVMNWSPKPGGLELDNDIQLGFDQLMGRRVWEIWVQATRL